MTITNEVYRVAESYLGLQEWAGAKHNPKIVEMYAASGHSWVQDDETPWCAAFVNSVLAQVGIRGTLQLNARSFCDWEREVDLEDAQKGDIVVFWRGSKSGWKGHVAFYSHHDASSIYVLGGNQGDAVSVQAYPHERLLTVRTYGQPKATRTSPVQSKTIQTTVAQGAAAVTGGVTAVAQLEGPTQIAVVVCCAIVALGAFVIFRERLKKWSSGDR